MTARTVYRCDGCRVDIDPDNAEQHPGDTLYHLYSSKVLSSCQQREFDIHLCGLCHAVLRQWVDERKSSHTRKVPG